MSDPIRAIDDPRLEAARIYQFLRGWPGARVAWRVPSPQDAQRVAKHLTPDARTRVMFVWPDAGGRGGAVNRQMWIVMLRLIITALDAILAESPDAAPPGAHTTLWEMRGKATNVLDTVERITDGATQP